MGKNKGKKNNNKGSQGKNGVTDASKNPKVLKDLSELPAAVVVVESPMSIQMPVMLTPSPKPAIKVPEPPSVTNNTLVAEKNHFGFVVDTYLKDGSPIYAKVHTKIDGQWTSILWYNVPEVYPQLTKVNFSVGTYTNKYNKTQKTAENVIVIDTNPSLKRKIEEKLTKNSVKRIYITDLVEDFEEGADKFKDITFLGKISNTEIIIQ